MNAVNEQRQRVQHRLLDLFFEDTGLPIALYEIKEGHPQLIITEASKDNFRKFCRLVQSLPGGEKKCIEDQCNRARDACRGLGITGDHGSQALCHAGLWNQHVPIVVRGETRGILLFGEMRLADTKKQQQSLVRLEGALRELGADGDLSAAIREAHTAAPCFTDDDVKRHIGRLQAMMEWFYTLVYEQDHLELSADRVTHEVQTRMTALMAQVENLVTNLPTAPPLSEGDRELRKRADQVMHSVQALDTVLQTLGDSLGEYHFVNHKVMPMLATARSIYIDEAASRDIEIMLEGKPVLEAELSEAHFQHALNNLVHNAIKYSFRTVPQGRRRWVRVRAFSENDELGISVSNYGIGILPAEIDSGVLFQLNQRGQLTHNEFRRGSGKGLYFVKRVVDEHGGRIEVVSDPVASEASPEGSPHHNRFSVFVPLRQANREKNVLHSVDRR
jgi:signal transduction histidine kinase